MLSAIKKNKNRRNEVLQATNDGKVISCPFVNTKEWNEGKWRLLREECKEYDTGLVETCWHISFCWQERRLEEIGRG